MPSQNSYKGFTELECWIQARKLRLYIAILVKPFPKHEKYALIGQLIRASRSVTNNIAEGYGRFAYSDTRHFFIQARGSLAETIDHLIIAYDEHYISPDQFGEVRRQCELVFKLINGYIKYLDEKKSGTKPNP